MPVFSKITSTVAFYFPWLRISHIQRVGNLKLTSLPYVISGTYKLVEVNDKKLPAVSWIDLGEECSQETLSGTLLVDSENRWAARVEERELCAKTSEDVSACMARSAIFIGSFKVSGSKYEFHEETLDVTDYVSIDGGILRYISADIGDFEGQTGVFVFLRDK